MNVASAVFPTCTIQTTVIEKRFTTRIYFFLLFLCLQAEHEKTGLTAEENTEVYSDCQTVACR